MSCLQTNCHEITLSTVSTKTFLGLKPKNLAMNKVILLLGLFLVAVAAMPLDEGELILQIVLFC